MLMKKPRSLASRNKKTSSVVRVASFAIAIPLLLLLLTSCAWLPTRPKALPLPEIRVGTEGLVTQFEELPQEALEGSLVTAIVEVENRGAHDVRAGVWTITLEPGVLELVSPVQPIGQLNLLGKSVYQPKGEFAQLVFRLRVGKLPALVEHYTTPIVLSTCYRYATELHATTCVDTDIAGAERIKPCTPQSETFGRGQGGPLAVTVIEPKMLPHSEPDRVEPQFIIEIENKGQGEVLAERSYSKACTGVPIRSEEYSLIDVEVFLEERPLRCREDELILRDGKTRVLCNVPQGVSTARGTYIAPLRVELSYGYAHGTSTQLKLSRFGRAGRR